MAKKFTRELVFPVGGLDESLSYQKQPPFTTPDAENVRGWGEVEGRARGGSRPGLGKEFSEQLGSGSPIRLLAPVTTVGDTTGAQFVYWSDNFDRSADDLGTGWTTASWLSSQPSTSSDLTGAFQFNGIGGAVRDALSFSTSYVYDVGIRIIPWLNQHWGTYHIYARMDDTTPAVTTDGVDIQITLSGSSGAYFGKIVSYVSGASAETLFTSGSTGSANSDYFKARISGDTIKVYWGETKVCETQVPVGVGTRVGFGMSCTGSYPDSIALVSLFRLIGVPANATASNQRSYRTYLVASAGGTLYYDNSIGIMEAVTSDIDFSSDHYIQAAERAQSLYIADWSPPRISGTDGTIAADGTTLDAASVSDWSAHSIDADGDVVVIETASGDVTAGTYEISSVAAGSITLGRSTGGAGTCDYKILAGPKVFTPATGTLARHTTTSGEGTVPGGCKCVCVYRDRIVYAGADVNPHVWYMSRQGDPNDFDYSDTDKGAACAGTNTEAGRIAEPITALISYKDDYLIFGCMRSVWMLKGDPMFTGLIDSISKEVGIVGPAAWCQGPQGEVYFLSMNGLCRLTVGNFTVENLSRGKLPQKIRNIDVEQVDISMGWDSEEQGIHLFLRSVDGSTRTHYFYDLQFGAFWPQTFSSDHEPASCVNYRPEVADYAKMLVGCSDGYIRGFDSSNHTDDGTEITSYVYYGPIRLGNSQYREGVLTAMYGFIGHDSGDIDWDLYAGDNHEDAVNGNSKYNGTWDCPAASDTSNVRSLQSTVRRRVRGGSFALKLSNSTTRPWTIERVLTVSKMTGKHRIE